MNRMRKFMAKKVGLWWVVGVVIVITFVSLSIWWLTDTQLEFGHRAEQALGYNITVVYPNGLPYESIDSKKVVIVRTITTTGTMPPLIVSVRLNGGIAISPTTNYIGDMFEITFPQAKFSGVPEFQKRTFFIKNKYQAKGSIFEWTVPGSLVFAVKPTAQSNTSPSPISVSIPVETAWRRTVYSFLTNDVKKNSPVFIFITGIVALAGWLWKNNQAEKNKKKERDRAAQKIDAARQALKEGNIDYTFQIWRSNLVRQYAVDIPDHVCLEQICRILEDRGPIENLILANNECLAARTGAFLWLIEHAKLNTQEKLSYISKFKQHIRSLNGSVPKRLEDKETEYKNRLPENFDIQKIWRENYIDSHKDNDTKKPVAEYERDFLYTEGGFWNGHPVYKKLKRNHPDIIVGEHGSGKTALALGLVALQKYKHTSTEGNFLPAYIAMYNDKYDKYTIEMQISLDLLEFVVQNALLISRWNTGEQKLFIRHINTFVDIDIIEKLIRDKLKPKEYEKNKSKKNEDEKETQELNAAQSDDKSKLSRAKVEKLYLTQLMFVVESIKQARHPKFKPHEWLNNFGWILPDLKFQSIFLVIDVPSNVSIQPSVLQQILNRIPCWACHGIMVKLLMPKQEPINEYDRMSITNLTWDAEKLEEMMKQRGVLPDELDALDLSTYTTPAAVIHVINNCCS